MVGGAGLWLGRAALIAGRGQQGDHGQGAGEHHDRRMQPLRHPHGIASYSELELVPF
jgi:hypothetical protein